MPDHGATDPLTDVHDDGSVDWGRLARQFGVSIVVALIVLVGLGVGLQGPIERFSAWFIGIFGLAGVFVGVLLTDTFHLTHEPVLLAASIGGVAFWPLVGVASVASIAAGPLGWLIGRRLGQVGAVSAFLRRHRLDAFLQRYGFAAIAIAALTPIPYAATTWAAGAAGVRFPVLLAGCLFRVPKVLFWTWVVVTGWSFGVSL